MLKCYGFIAVLLSFAFPLTAQIEESILPLLDAIYLHGFQRKITPQQRTYLQYATQYQHQKLRVVTYNMLYNIQAAEDKLPAKHRWSSRKLRLLEYLAFTKADIIGSQELQEDQLQELQDILRANYSCYGVRTREKEGRTDINAIFFNPHRLELIDSKTIFYQEKSGENGFTYCYFRDKLLNKKFSVINTKLTWGLTWGALKKREAEAKELSQYVRFLPSNEPIVVLGDFNTIPLLDGMFIEKILTKYHLRDAKSQSIFEHCGPSCSLTHSNILLTPFTGPELRGFILDHIFINDCATAFVHGIDTAKVNGEFPSDHFPVVTDLFLNDNNDNNDGKKRP
jgi:endonuclease/exonuclease/phosphatase family metal-dependent hydrolase